MKTYTQAFLIFVFVTTVLSSAVADQILDHHPEHCVSADESSARIQVQVETASGDDLFLFKTIERPAVNDRGNSGKWTVVFGKVDRNSAALHVLNDGAVPTVDDAPADNFFFAAGTDGGSIMIDLGKKTRVAEIVSYSWHSGGRAPQVYSVFAATGDEPGFSLPSDESKNLSVQVWTLLAEVDTRKSSKDGGQHAAKIFSPDAVLGEYRYLIFQVERTNPHDAFGNTFFSEIDVIDADAPNPQRIAIPEKRVLEFDSRDGQYHFAVDVSNALELEEWTDSQLRPVIVDWYPRIVAMLPGEGFEPVKNVRFRYLPDAEMKGIPAYASGDTITMNREWFRGQLDGEAKGAVVHEMVHVVQSYQRRSSRSRGLNAPPGWIVEGIPDYIRWFLFEPETGGAELSPGARRNAKHDASYRTTANFIDWVIRKRAMDKQFLEKLNAAVRQGRYSTDVWKELTGFSESELAEAWRTE